MKPKTNKDEAEASSEVENPVAKRRGRKKLVINESGSAELADQPTTSKDVKKGPIKKTLAKKTLTKPLGIRKTLRHKKILRTKEKIAKAAKTTVVKRASRSLVRKNTKTSPKVTEEDTAEESLLMPAEIKQEPLDDISTSDSRSSSPATVTRRQRVTSDMAMMKSVLGDSPSMLLTGSRSMRADRSSSPYSPTDQKKTRGPQPRKPKNLLNEAVKNEHKKRRRQLSETKLDSSTEGNEEAKKIKRTLSGDGSEISKCSDITESDMSLSLDIDCISDAKENKNETKTETLLANEPKKDSVPCSRINRKSRESLPGTTSTESALTCETQKRSNSLDIDNNNARSRTSSIDGKNKTDGEQSERSSILDVMSKTFNKVSAKNIYKSRRGRKIAEAKTRSSKSKSNELTDVAKPETPEISEIKSEVLSPLEKTVNILGHQTELKENKMSPDEENMKLSCTDSPENSVEMSKENAGYKAIIVHDIGSLMDKLKQFEELDKKRQQELKAKNSEIPPLGNDVVLIPKSVPEKVPKSSPISNDMPPLKENLLSCFENNSAISILRRDQSRKSVDIDLTNSITLIKRNSTTGRKDSTASNPSKDSSEALSIIEKSLGKGVTLEIRKSFEKTAESPPVKPLGDANHQNTVMIAQHIAGVVVDPKEITITKEPRVETAKVLNSSTESRNSIDDIIKAIDEVTNDTTMTEVTDSCVEEVSNVNEGIADVIERNIKNDAMKENIPKVVASAGTVSKSDSFEEIKIEEKEPISEVKAISNDSGVIGVQEEKRVNEIIAIPNDTANVVSPVPEPVILKDEITEDKLESKEECETVVIQPKGEQLEIKSKEKSPKSKAAKHSPNRAKDVKTNKKDPLWETPERLKQKETVLRTLGLLTHKAADEAKVEKQKQKELILANVLTNKLGKGKSKENKERSAVNDYTGTLKIKLNRVSNEKRRTANQSLKFTFSKKGRGGKHAYDAGEDGYEAEDIYTIQKEGATGTQGDVTGGQRKFYSNRFNNNDPQHAPLETQAVDAKGKPVLVIPEKASSFSIHPGRICQDQCFYCGGRFGLFDTPCHIAQIKSRERQNKILDNEEKLTVDSCLCDACYRHVDRRANCPSYRKRPVNLKALETQPNPFAHHEDGEGNNQSSAGNQDQFGQCNAAKCHAEGCTSLAENTIRRKWLIKMRNSVNKVLKLQSDYPGLHTIPLCPIHYQILTHLMVCALCKRRLNKHHNTHYIKANQTLNPLLTELKIPVELEEKAVVCKICRYFCTLLSKPHQQQTKRNFMKIHRNRLLHVYNVDVPPDEEDIYDESQFDEENIAEIPDSELEALDQERKKKNKNKNRRSTDSNKTNSEDNSDMNGSEDNQTVSPMEQDIESLISSNKIPVPNANHDDPLAQLEGAVIPAFDKQSELQYLLQKQNNPAQFLQKPFSKTKHSGKITKPQLKNDKLAKKIQKLGQNYGKKDLQDVAQTLSEEITVEPLIPGKKSSSDISLLKNKWVMSESFTQVKKNLSELSKNLNPDGSKKDSVKKLETNPSLSVRELLPGEEDLNLQCNIDFDNVKETSQYGWEKCNSTIQYDLKTKKLFDELQKPYGNQSSFLRHLLILEKYYRNGDLVLASNANPSAQTYSISVSSRLRAFDNFLPPNTSSLIDFRRQKPGKSLLKNSHSSSTKSKAPVTPQKQQHKVSITSVPISLPPSVVIETKPAAPPPKAKPPELIAINSANSGRKSIENVLKNIQQLVKGVSAPKSPSPIQIEDNNDSNKSKSETESNKGENCSRNETETLNVLNGNVPSTSSASFATSTPKTDKLELQKVDNPKCKTPVKGWRPTLIPITQDNVDKIAKEKPQPAADGRLLPSLVQVLSKGKRFHITLKDYNKMCIMRREKLKEVNTLATVEAITSQGTTVTPFTVPVNSFKNVTVTTQSMPMSLPAAIAQLGPSVSVTTEMMPEPPKSITGTTITATLPNMPQGLPKIPKSLTVIPQTVAINTGMMLPMSLPMFSGVPLAQMTTSGQTMVLPNQRP